MSKHQHVAIVGGSLGGINVAQELRRQGHIGQISLIGEENVRAPYDRTELSKGLLTGKREVEELFLLTSEEMDELELDLHLGRRAQRLDTLNRVIHLDNGTNVSYETLVIATGSVARRPGFIGNLEGVHVLRNLADGIALKTELETAQKVVIVGAGFIGAEVASSLRTCGQEVTLVDPQPAPLAAVLGPSVAEHYAKLHSQHGTVLEMGRGVASLTGDKRVTGVVLDDGRVLPADLVVVGLGAVAATQWLEDSGLVIDNGVVCDDGGHSSIEGVYAVGDVARWHSDYFGDHVRTEHWVHATLQAAVVAENIVAGTKVTNLGTAPSFWSDQFHVRMQMIGAPRPGDTVDFVQEDTEEGRFVALYAREDRLTGALSFHYSPRVLNRYHSAVQDRRTASEMTSSALT